MGPHLCSTYSCERLLETKWWSPRDLAGSERPPHQFAIIRLERRHILAAFEPTRRAVRSCSETLLETSLSHGTHSIYALFGGKPDFQQSASTCSSSCAIQPRCSPLHDGRAVRT